MLVIFLRFDLQQWQLRVRCISSVTRTLTRLSPVFGGPARKPPKTKTWQQETNEKIGCPLSRNYALWSLWCIRAFAFTLVKEVEG